MRTLHNQIEIVKKAQMMVAILLVAVLAAFYFAVYRPQMLRMARLRIEIQSRTSMLSINQRKAQDLPQVARDVERLTAELHQIDKQLPKQEEYGQFTKEINAIKEKQSSLGDIAFNRDNPIKRDDPKYSELFKELPLAMRFQGDYVSVFSFLRQTEDMQRLTRLRSLSIKSKPDKPGQVDVQLSMNIYWAETE